MNDSALEEAVLRGWVGLNGMLKDSQMTKNLTYNEAVVMLLTYERYREDGVGAISVQELLKGTGLLKSLMNRTLNALWEKGYLSRERRGRMLYVKVRPERLDDFLTVHQQSLSMVRRIIDIIGPEDAVHFVRICSKLRAADLSFPPKTATNEKEN